MEAMEEQLGAMAAPQHPNPAEYQAQVMSWLLNNPDGPSPEEQGSSLALTLQHANSPTEAAALVLDAIAERMMANRA
jgi:hypothetical protein